MVAKQPEALSRWLFMRLTLVVLATSFVANAMLIISWAASQVDENGHVYFMNHGQRIILPLPPLDRSLGLFALLLILLVAQVSTLLFIGLKNSRRGFKTTNL
jgi:hypothetical protein